MKTRILAFLLAFSCFFCLSACSENEDPSANFSRGTFSDGVYTNSFAGITLSLSEEWKIYSDEALEEMYGSVLTFDEDEKMLTCYDFVAVREDGTSVTVTYSDLDAFYGGGIGEKEYLESALELLRSEMENAYGSCVCEMGEVSLSGKTVPCISSVIKQNGSEIFNSVVVKKTGSVMASLSVAALSEEAAEEGFSRLSL